MGASFDQKYEIARLVREQGVTSRLDISKAIDIALPTVSTLVRDLIRRGLIREDGFGHSAGGRKPARLKLNPDFAGAVGLEISARGISGAVVDMSGAVRAREAAAKPEISERPHILDVVLNTVERLLEHNCGLPIRGIGVGVSGLVDRAGRVSREIPLSKGWKDIPLADMLEKRFGLPSTLLNAVHAGALGECRFGQGLDGRNMLFLHVGRGIAVGIIADGALYRGETGNAGEFGHSVIQADGPICFCGNRGCLESLASPQAIVSQCREALAKDVRSRLAQEDPDALTLGRVMAAAEAGDRLAVNVLDEAGQYIGGALAGLVNVLNPGVLMFGGLLAQEGHSPLTDAIERAFRGKVLPLLRDETRVKVSELGEDACAIGAAAAVFDALFDSPASLLGKRERHSSKSREEKKA